MSTATSHPRNLPKAFLLMALALASLVRGAAAATIASAALAFPLLGDEPPAPAPAPTPTPPTVQLHGFADVYADWNPNLPSDRDNFEPGTGTSGQKANEFNLNLAALDVSLEPSPVGFHVVAVAGTGTNVLHAAEIDSNTWKYVYQASVSWTLDVGRGLLLEMGIMPSYIGFESFTSKDDWNYTRGWLAEFSPYYQTGLRASTSFDDHWSAQLWVMNGWQNIEDNNDGKSFGTQVAFSSGPLTVTENVFGGPELTDDDAHWRVFSDTILAVKASDSLQLALIVDLGRQSLPGLPAAEWQGVALAGRYALSRCVAFALRGDWYHDPEGVISGIRQTVWGTTLTAEYRPVPRLILKLEGRYDRSSALAFGGSTGPLTRQDEPLLILGAVATF